MGPDMLLAGLNAGRLLRLAVTRNTLRFLRGDKSFRHQYDLTDHAALHHIVKCVGRALQRIGR